MNDSKNFLSVSSVENYTKINANKLQYNSSFLNFQISEFSVPSLAQPENLSYSPDLYDLFFFKDEFNNLFSFFDNSKSVNICLDSANQPSFLSNFDRKFGDFSEISRFVKRTQGVKLPFRLIKNFVPYENSYSSSDNFFNFFFGEGKSFLEEKNFSNSTFLVLKQKKYTAKSNFPITTIYDDFDKKLVKYSGRTILLNNSIFSDYLEDSNIAYRLLRKNKKRSEYIPTTLAKRLLRVRRTLVLPAHINLTVITNSFDIVHS